MIGRIGKEKENQFRLKRIQVYQMYETEEQRMKREVKERQETEEKERKYQEEIQQLKEKSEIIKEEYSNEIQQIEKWSKMKYQSVIFDSDICQWNINNSTFDKHIWNKENVGILIETSFGVKYGGFVYSKIDKYQTEDENGKTHGVIDPKSFVFSFKDNKPMKYEKKEEKKNESSFFLYQEDDPRLFSFGNYDALIGKEEYKAYCYQDADYCHYDYRGNEKALTGIIKRENKIEIKRIIVFQFHFQNFQSI